MNRPYARDTLIEVDLDAITNNIHEFQRRLDPQIKMMAVVKADAYGHGAVFVAQAALEAGATYLGVALVDEGIELREAGITAPILVLGFTPLEDIHQALCYDLTMTLFSEESLQVVNQVARQLSKKAKIHVKIDTGMGRIGLWGMEAIPFIMQAMECREVILEGVFTHFSTADEADQSYTQKQMLLFQQVVQELTARRIHIPLIHCANSATAIQLPGQIYNMIRLGISLYGFYPSGEVDQQAVSLVPALKLKSKVVQVKKLPKGTGISYGKTYMTSGEETIATVPIGYADGINRHLSNVGHALVKGVKVPIVGRVCMDFLMLDVTRALPVQIGDEVVLYGNQGHMHIHVDEVAAQLQTINYEITCMLSHRIPRIYLSKGEQVALVNRLRKHDSKKSSRNLIDLSE